MREYSIRFARSARKELEALDPSVALRVLGKIEGLGTNPRPVGVVKIGGAESLWRIRVGDWRVIYQIFDRDHAIDIVAVRHRGDAYRR